MQGHGLFNSFRELSIKECSVAQGLGLLCGKRTLNNVSRHCYSTTDPNGVGLNRANEFR